jgi:hypothetical protein
VPDQRLVQRDEPQAEPQPLVRVLLFEAPADGLHLVAGLLGRDAVAQARHRAQRVTAAPLRAVAERRHERLEEVHLRGGGRELEVGRQDADDRHGAVAKCYLLADCAGVGVEEALPQPRADEDDGRRARPVFLRREGAPRHRLQVQQREEVGGHGRAGQLLLLLADAQQRPRAGVGGDVRERLRPRAPVGEVRVGNDLRLVGPHAVAPRRHQPPRILVRQRPQQHGVHHREDGAVGPDAERQRHHGDGRKPRPLRQHPQPVPNVLQQSPHESISTRLRIADWGLEDILV